MPESDVALVDDDEGLVEAVLFKLPLVVSLVELCPALVLPVVGEVAVLLTEYSGAAALGDGIEAPEALLDDGVL